MQHLDTFAAFAATYGSLEDADAGYKAMTHLSHKDSFATSTDQRP